MTLVWLGFVTLILALLALDLGVFHRQARAVTVREALGWSAVWIVLGLSFSVFVYSGYEKRWLGLGEAKDAVEATAEQPEGTANDGGSAFVKYLTGYIVEKSLSIDNVFVIALIFSSLGVPAAFQHRVLFWGVLGALALRGVMIAAGARLIAEFSWVLYIFGGFLVLTAIKMLLMQEAADPNDSWMVKLTRRILPVTERFHGEHFFVRAGSAASHEPESPGASVQPDAVVARAVPGALLLTPLALALVMVEGSDLVFAVDSIPAIFAITAAPFLVFTSNVFAILGLRSLYIALSGALKSLHYLKYALALVLAVIGVKMLAHHWLKALLGPSFSLYVLALVLLILATGVVASLRRQSGPPARPRPPAG